MPWSGPRATRDIWWFFLLVLLGDVLLTGFNFARTARNDSIVAHTLEVLNRLNALQSSLIDSETGARGFVIVGRDEFLEPYRESLPNADELLAELRALTANNPQMQQRLDELEPAMAQRLEILRRLIETRRLPNRDPAREADLVTRGKSVMDRLRAQIGRMVGEEQQLLSERRESAKAAFTASLLATIIGGAVTIGTLILTNYLIRRENQIRQKSAELLKQSEERFRVIAESLPQFVWVTRANGQFEYFNRRWYDYTGQSPEESMGAQWSSALHPDDRETFERRWKRSIKSGQRFEIEYRIRRQDGAYRWFLGRAIPLHDDAGRTARWFGTCTDIDDQKRTKEELEQRVRERTAQLQQA